MAIGLIAVPSVACMVLSGLSLARWEYLSTPRIVQRDQPATILLLAQDVSRFPTHYNHVARGIGPTKTPPADVERHTLSFD